MGNESVATDLNAVAAISSGVGATASIGDNVTIITSVSFTLPNNGVEVTAGVGSPTIIGAGIVGVSGQAVTSGLGDESVVGDANVFILTGVEATASIGDEEVIIPVMAQGVGATGGVASSSDLSVVGTSLVTPSGIEATASTVDPSDLSVVGTSILTSDGVEATGNVASSSDLTVTGSSVFTLNDGVEATASVGNEIVFISVSFDVSGVEATASVASSNDINILLSILFSVSGVESTASVSASDNITVTGDATFEPNEGLVGTTSLGNETLELITPVDITGVEALAEVLGEVALTFRLDAIFSVTGLSMTTNIGNVLVYGDIRIDASDTYSEVTASQTPNYSTVTPDQNPVWDEEAA